MLHSVLGQALLIRRFIGLGRSRKVGALEKTENKAEKYVPKIEMQWLGKTLSYGDEDLLFKFNHKALPPMLMHKSVLPREERAGTSRELLAALASECMVEWMIMSLKRAGIPIEEFNTETEAKMGSDETGRAVVDRCDTEVNLRVPADRLEEARMILEHLLEVGCLMSRSVGRGVKFNYKYNWLNEASGPADS
ncbi:MAG: OsmC family protein [Candidatus Bathyarchaeota archaeon]|nr:OsmC family protein [Candidatus Bathyarchaeota archaeon]